MSIKFQKKLVLLTMLGLIALSLGPNPVMAALINGVVSPGEYSNGVIYDVDLGYISGGDWVDVDADGKLYLAWNTPSQLAVAYEVPFAINDNYFGTSSQLHPTAPWPGNGRDYGALEASDMAQFEFRDSTGGLLVTFQMDYFRDLSLPDQTVGSGKDKYKIDTAANSFVMFGDSTVTYNPETMEFENTILEMATSLSWNYSEGGYIFDDADRNSPEPSDPNYVGTMIYEFLIDSTLLNGDFGLLLAESHHSPSKLEIESFVTPPDTPPYSPVPEPATVLLMGSGLLGAGFFGRKRFKK